MHGANTLRHCPGGGPAGALANSKPQVWDRLDMHLTVCGQHSLAVPRPGAPRELSPTQNLGVGVLADGGWYLVSGPCLSAWRTVSHGGFTRTFP